MRIALWKSAVGTRRELKRLSSSVTTKDQEENDCENHQEREGEGGVSEPIVVPLGGLGILELLQLDFPVCVCGVCVYGNVYAC